MNAKLTRPIFLIGMMGSGKSSIGRRLCRNLRVPFLDLDAQVQEAAGMSIPEIFQLQGEAGFRELETGCLELSLVSAAIISTGGGVVVTPRNREILKRAAIEGAHIIYLNADPRTLARRASMQPASRPLLLGESGTFNFHEALQRLEKMLDIRDPLYRECATFVVEAAQQKPGVIVAEIAQHLATG